MMVPDTVTDVLNEIIPEADRGKSGGAGSFSSGCTTVTIHWYEFVDITRSSHECSPLQAHRERLATLVFKWPECAAVQPARRQATR